MPRVVIVLLALLALPAAGIAAEPQRLTSGGQPVDFARWAPVAPAFAYRDFAFSPARRQALEADGTDLVYRLYRSEIHLRADGTVTETETKVRALLTPSAVRNDGDGSAWVDAFSETATIEQAYSLLPDGTRVPVDPATVQTTPEEEDRIFSDFFEITLPFGGLVPGAMTVLVVRTEHDGNAFPLPWSRILPPQLTVPMARFELQVTWDEGVAAPAWRSDSAGLDCRADGPRRLTCAASDVPPFEADPDMLYRDRMPIVVVAEPVTWSALARLEQGLFERALAAGPDQGQALAETAARLTRDAVGPEARLAAIHRFVSQQVRYLGLEHGLGGIVPRPTHLTLARRFGDCKDKTALFVDLARRAGLEAYPVLTSTERRNIGKLLLPAAGYFNHMIACVRLPADNGRPEREICLDLTDPYSDYDVLSRGAQGAIRLDVGPWSEAPGQLPADDHGWVMTQQTEHRLTPEGGLETEVTRSYAGLNAAWLRARLQGRNREARQDWLRDDFYDDYRDEVELISASAEGIDGLTGEVRVRTRSFFAESFDPDDLTDFDGSESELQDEVRAFRTENEHHPYQFPGLRFLATTRYRLPAGHRMTSAGAETDFRSEFGRFRVTYRDEAGAVLVTSEVTMPRALIAPESIDRFNAFLGHVREHAQIRFEIARDGRGRPAEQAANR